MFEKKGLLLILDGLGDRPVEELKGKTPLEAARTPHMDLLLKDGMAGLVHQVEPGIPVGTHTGSGLLLGVAPSEVEMLSRGLVQASGAGITLKPEDIALRCNFATLSWNADRAEILDRRAGRISEGVDVLANALNELPAIEGVKCIVSPSTHYRASLVMRGDGLSHDITNTDPGSSRLEKGLLLSRPLLAGNEAAVRTAHALNQFLKRSYAVLKDHSLNRERIERALPPANGLLTRGAGKMHQFKNLLHFQKIKTALVTGEGTLYGVGKLFNFEVHRKSSFTAGTDTDLEGKVALALQLLERNDLVVMHIKGTDVCAHDRNPVEKKEFIEAVDFSLKTAPIYRYRDWYFC